MTGKSQRTSTKKQEGPSQRRRTKVYALLPILVALVVAFSAACGPAESQLAPVSQLSTKIRNAPPVVQEAYRFALANPELLEKLPCYCGCGNMEHMDNLDCFVQDFNPDGSVVFDYHALG